MLEKGISEQHHILDQKFEKLIISRTFIHKYKELDGQSRHLPVVSSELLYNKFMFHNKKRAVHNLIQS